MPMAHLAKVEGNHSETLIMCKEGEVIDNVNYALDGTPCAASFVENNFAIYYNSLAEVFPHAKHVNLLKLESYIGVGLRSYKSDENILLLAVYDTKPIPAPLTQEQQIMLHLFGEKLVREYELNKMLGEVRATNKVAIELSNANIAKKVATGIAHELNQPLSAISIYAEGLSKNILNPDYSQKNEKAASKIAMLSRRCGTIINRVKSFVQTGQLCKTHVSLESILQRVLESLEYELSSNAISLQYDSNIKVVLFVDAFQLEQVFTNLFTNSIHALNQKSNDELKQIIIKVHHQEDRVEIMIRDNGTGISTERLAQITQPFVSDKGSFGIGLSLVYSIIEAHHGSIRIESALGKGTEVALHLPMSES